MRRVPASVTSVNQARMQMQWKKYKVLSRGCTAAKANAWPDSAFAVSGAPHTRTLDRFDVSSLCTTANLITALSERKALASGSKTCMSGSVYKHAIVLTPLRNTQDIEIAPNCCQRSILIGMAAMKSPRLKADSAANRAVNMEAWEVHSWGPAETRQDRLSKHPAPRNSPRFMPSEAAGKPSPGTPAFLILSSKVFQVLNDAGGSTAAACWAALPALGTQYCGVCAAHLLAMPARLAQACATQAQQCTGSRPRHVYAHPVGCYIAPGAHGSIGAHSRNAPCSPRPSPRHAALQCMQKLR